MRLRRWGFRATGRAAENGISSTVPRLGRRERIRPSATCSRSPSAVQLGGIGDTSSPAALTWVPSTIRAEVAALVEGIVVTALICTYAICPDVETAGPTSDPVEICRSTVTLPRSEERRVGKEG